MKKEIIIIFAVLTVLLTGCNREDSPVSIIPSGVLSVTVDIPQNTKASYNKTVFNNGDYVSMWVTTNRGSAVNKLEVEGNYADNNKFVFNSTSNKLEPTGAKVTFPKPDSRLGVYCVYPYSASYALKNDAGTTVLQHKVLADQTSAAGYSSSDLMTGSRGFTGYSVADMSAPQAVSFYHRLARFDIELLVPLQYGNATFVGVNYVKITNHILSANVPMSVTAEDKGQDPNTTMPAVVDGTVTGDVTMHRYDENLTASPLSFKFEAVIVPQTVAVSTPIVEISVKYENGSTPEDKMFYYMTGANLTFAAGKSHGLQLTVSNLKPIVFDDIVVSPWNSSSSSGSMTE